MEEGRPWSMVSTQHFDFYFHEAIDSALRTAVVEAQERSYGAVMRYMEVSGGNGPRIRFWLFPDKATKQDQTGSAASAHAIIEYRSVYHIPANAVAAQEVAHQLTVHFWGKIPNTNGMSLLVEEGFAYHIEEDFWLTFPGQLPFDSVAMLGVTHSEYCGHFSITNLAHEGEDNSWGTEQAQVAASFVGWLIRTYGISRFGELYRLVARDSVTNLTHFAETYGTNLRGLAQEFHSYLGVRPCQR